MILINEYDSAVLNKEIDNDTAQREIVLHMQRVADELEKYNKSWFPRFNKNKIKGIYLHGPVGVGKTFLSDLFFEFVPCLKKSRYHFHQFMQQIDAQLRQLQGQKDPLRKIAANIAKTTQLLCFDEFMVYDVADAMILAELLQALFAQSVVLVATSNIPPDDLYLNGPQRNRFLPAIDLINEHCEILVLGDHRDYRLGRTPLAKAYIYPLNKAAKKELDKQFTEISSKITENSELSIQNRQIPAIKISERAVWFKFDVICNLPRSQLDYLEIADRFDTVFLSEIPALTINDTVRVILLINFVDVMYDRGIKLVITAAVALDKLYVTGDLSFKFKRTLSRLEEMQSEDYSRRHQRRNISIL